MTSGESVCPFARYYQVEPADIIVIHDDLDLEFGKLRSSRWISSGGQNGIKSIAQHLGTQEFHRAKVGIGRPPGRMDPAAYVLPDFQSHGGRILYAFCAKKSATSRVLAV